MPGYTTVTSAYTITTADSVVVADATAAAFTVTLPTAVGNTGRIFTVKCLSSGDNAVTVAVTSSQTIDGVTAWPLRTQGATLTVLSDGVNWQVLRGYRESVNVQSWAGTEAAAVSGTWIKPPGARVVHVVLCSSGGGGGSGRRGAPGTIRCGGGGGGGGSLATFTIPASDLNATEVIFAPRGGQGGAAVTTDDTNGNPGTLGGGAIIRNPSFCKIASAVAAGGGTATNGTAGNPYAMNTMGSNGGAGGAANTSGGAGASGAVLGGSNLAGGTGGGAGGGITAANVPNAGGNAGNQVTLAGGTGGAAGGGNGTQATAIGGLSSSVGGGGGGASIDSAGGNGANAAVGGYGGGGGGGGASTNGFNSGAGGNGGPGFVIVTTYC